MGYVAEFPQIGGKRAPGMRVHDQKMAANRKVSVRMEGIIFLEEPRGSKVGHGYAGSPAGLYPGYGG